MIIRPRASGPESDRRVADGVPAETFQVGRIAPGSPRSAQIADGAPRGSGPEFGRRVADGVPAETFRGDDPTQLPELDEVRARARSPRPEFDGRIGSSRAALAEQRGRSSSYRHCGNRSKSLLINE